MAPFRRLIWILGFLLWSVVPSAAQPSSEEASVQHVLRQRIEAERVGLSGLAAGIRPVYARQSVLQYYEGRNYAPVWVEAAEASPHVDSLLAVLGEARRDGLTPGNYHVASIRALRDTASSPRALTDLELLSTDAFLLFGSHLLSGHVSPETLVPTWNVPGRRADLFRLLDAATERNAENGTALRSALTSLRPQHPEYGALVSALRTYREIASRGGWSTVDSGPKLERGSTDRRVNDLRERLALTGDVPAEDGRVDSAATDVFDAVLEDGVRRFQERHGLTSDGVVGPATLAALNVPVETRLRQLRVNLERWRWLPQDLGRRYVLVNIAGFTLRVVEDGQDVLTMRVVTGRPYRQTPVFSGTISYLVLNPYWHVPPSLAVRDKLPEIQKNAGYFAAQNIKVFRGWGADAQPIDPATVDWASLSASNFPYRLRQDPGPNNALGRVKFMFPNTHNVYLHDTPSRSLFGQSARSFSSGCIRLENPMALTTYLLADHPTWTSDRVDAVLKTPSQETAIVLPEPVPVHLQYWTAWVDGDTRVHFRPDVYTRDAAVYDALAVPKPAPAVSP